MCLLLGCWVLTGAVVQLAAVTHYRLRSSSVCLHVNQPPPYRSVSWSFASKLIVSDGDLNPAVAKKMDFSPSNLTLCIRDLGDEDTGVYQANIHLPHFSQSTETHKVIVQDAVPRPVLHMSLLGSNRSSGLCSVSVNCSVQDEWVSTVCSEDLCKVSQGTTQKVNITIVSTGNWTVVCSGNNQVSAETVSTKTSAVCFTEPVPEDTSHPGHTTVIVLAVVVSVFPFVAFGAMRLFSKCPLHQRRAPVEDQPRVSSSSPSPSEVSYENVDATQHAEDTGSAQTREVDTVDTVYSVLHAVKVTPPVESETLGGASDSQRHQQVT